MNAIPYFDRLAHDLKGPLAPLQTAAYLLRQPGLDMDRQQELARIIERQSQRLARMIDEAGDWARASSGSLVAPDRRPCDIGLLLDMAVGSVAGCQAQPDVAGELPAVQGDETRLLQMLVTLVGLVQPREGGEVPTVSASAVDGGVRLAFVAERSLFDPEVLFEQPMAEPHDEGLGLRAMTAAAIARAHGGSLHAAQSGAGGLRLTCELPAA